VSAELLVATLSTAIALAATAVGVWVHGEQSRQAAFELARTLHMDLTTGDVVRARVNLITYLRHPGESSEELAQEALRSYYVLLWCFERILTGRRVLNRSRKWNPSLPAVKFLNALVQWHVETWREDLPAIRRRLRSDLGALGIPFLDNHSWSSFENLYLEVVHTPLPQSGPAAGGGTA
jgi:hypothetical protein